MTYFSLKMRASEEDKHVSGGERIVEKENLEEVILELLNRPSSYDFLNIKVQKLKEIDYIEKSLDIKSYTFDNYLEANNFAISLLENAGIPRKISENYIWLLHTGAGELGNNMRGAMIVNLNGERLELDKSRGVRTTNVDFLNRKNIEKILLEKGFSLRTLDALALATKNLNHPDIIAEYCISDQQDYTTGYVAIKGLYNRISPLKKLNNPKGGRIYFVRNNTDIDKLYNYLQNKSFLIKDLGEIK